MLRAVSSLALLAVAAMSCANVLGLASDGDLRFQDGGGAGDDTDAADAARDAKAEAAVCRASPAVFTTGVSSVQVPPGCAHVRVKALGGGGGNCQGPALGGAGAVVTATILLDGITTLMVFVGARGGDLKMINTVSPGGQGGANGGEADPEMGSSPGSAGGGGGGSSEVAASCKAGMTPGTASACELRLVVAGGGGGCDYSSNAVGGAAAQVGVAGQALMSCGTPAPQSWAGQGALQTKQGAGGSSAGSGLTAMDGGEGTPAAGGAGQWGSGGGGGGYFSGGGGAGADLFGVTAGGGGGCSWVDETRGTGAIYTSLAAAGDGSVVLTWEP